MKSLSLSCSPFFFPVFCSLFFTVCIFSPVPSYLFFSFLDSVFLFPGFCFLGVSCSVLSPFFFHFNFFLLSVFLFFSSFFCSPPFLSFFPAECFLISCFLFSPFLFNFPSFSLMYALMFCDQSNLPCFFPPFSLLFNLYLLPSRSSHISFKAILPSFVCVFKLPILVYPQLIL